MEIKIATRFDLGWTEDEYNNFMIDLFKEMKRKPILPLYYLPCTKDSATITITSKDYFNPST